MKNLINNLKKAGNINCSDWINNNPDKGSEILIYPEQMTTYTEPKTIDEQIHPSFILKENKLPSYSVRNIKNGKCYIQNGIVLSPENVPFNEYSSDEKHPLTNKRRYKFNKTTKVDGKVAILSVEPLNINYYHWILESFPRTDLIKKSGFVPDKYIISCERSFQKEFLELLNIDESKVINNLPNMLIEADELIVPDLLNNSESIETQYGSYYNTRYFPRWIADYYRNIAKRNVKSTEKKRIYISRINSDHRRVTNEDEVESFIAKMDFKKYHLEHMNPNEQMDLFYNAEFIIAPHGAGLAGQVFCQENVKIIELFPDKYLCNSLQIISRALGYDYGYLLCDSIKNKNFDKDWLLVDDLKVDIKKLENIINLIGL